MSDSATPFFSIPFGEIPGFEEIALRAREMAELPAGFEREHFRRCSDAAFLSLREELERPPQQELMLDRESRNSIHMRLAAPDRSDWEWTITESNVKWNVLSPRSKLLREAVDQYFGCSCRCVGDQLYPPGGFRGWHTNRFDAEGWAMFLVEVEEENKSSFRYVDPRNDRMVVVPDKNARATFFRVSGEPLFWHAVSSDDTCRWSQGFMVPENWKERVF